MSTLVTIYWIWFGVSLAVLARRGVRKLWRIPTDDRRPASEAARASASPLVDPAPSFPPSPVIEAGATAAAADTPAPAPRPPLVPRPGRSPVAGARTSLAESLAGIRMPLDLAPLSHVAGSDPERRLVLTTNKGTSTAVDVALTEELERLGFAVARTGPTELLAHRGDHAVTLHVRAIGFPPSGGPADPAYPTATAGSVIVDIQLR